VRSRSEKDAPWACLDCQSCGDGRKRMRGCTVPRDSAYRGITSPDLPFMWRCPKGLLNPVTPQYDPGVAEIMAVAGDAEAMHSLLHEGGTDDQPAWFIEACRVVRSTTSAMMDYRRQASA